MSEGDPKRKTPAKKERPEQTLPSGPVSEETLIVLAENAGRKGWKSFQDLVGISKEDLLKIRGFSPQVVDDIERAKERLKRGEKNWDYRATRAQITVRGKTRNVLRISYRDKKDLGFAPIIGWFANEVLTEGLTRGFVLLPAFFEILRQEPGIKGSSQALDVLQANLDVFGTLFGSYKEIELEKAWLYRFKAKSHQGQRPRIRHT